MRLLEGKAALITGAARGIGRSIAETFAEHGALVACGDVEFEEAGRVAAGINGLAVNLDVTDPLSVQQAVDAVAGKFSRIDILVNNAGILRPHRIVDFPFEDWERIFRVNVHGTFLCSQAVARQMIRQGGGGSIINMSSASGKKADREESAYCASKSAVIGFTRVLALELGPYGIRANAILPGATDTEMLRRLIDAVPGVREELLAKTPLGKIATPRDQANAAVFLASELASHITGEQLVVSGGEFMET
jgi:NAD(P)-dependent dehydrogenase (short-subunit alcohol dehydrogenase family)